MTYGCPQSVVLFSSLYSRITFPQSTTSGFLTRCVVTPTEPLISGWIAKLATFSITSVGRVTENFSAHAEIFCIIAKRFFSLRCCISFFRISSKVIVSMLFSNLLLASIMHSPFKLCSKSYKATRREIKGKYTFPSVKFPSNNIIITHLT